MVFAVEAEGFDQRKLKFCETHAINLATGLDMINGVLDIIRSWEGRVSFDSLKESFQH